jgi:hypothetical protein
LAAANEKAIICQGRLGTNRMEDEQEWLTFCYHRSGEIQALIAESANPRNGSRYNICATDDSGELNVFALQAKLMRLFPDIRIGGAPEDGSLMRVHDGPRAHCDLARSELGLSTHHIDDTLKATGNTMIKLGLVGGEDGPAYKPSAKM